MDFTFSREQEEMRASVRSFLSAEAPSSWVRAMIDDELGVTPDVWEKMASLGWLGVLVPERAGGMGLGLIDAVVIQEELGAVAFPGPFFSSAIAATLAACRLGLDDLLRDLAAGERRGTVALEEARSAGSPLEAIEAIATAAGADRWSASGGGPDNGNGGKVGEWALHGTKPVVLDGASADWALVVARDASGLGTFFVENPCGEPVPALDVTRKLARLVLDGRRATRVGPPGDHSAIWARVIDDVGVALCAELVGACQRALDMAVEYAKVRVQFDRPIATFQVIKHKAADMLHRLELARVATHFAAWASDADDPERERAAAMAKGFAGEAACWLTGESIQIHGGLGFTWDVDCHLLYRRAKQNDLLFGSQGYQRRRLADLVIGPAEPMQ